MTDEQTIRMRVQENLDLTEIAEEFEMDVYGQEKLSEAVVDIVKCEVEEYARQAVTYALEQAAEKVIILPIKSSILSLKEQILKDLNL